MKTGEDNDIFLKETEAFHNMRVLEEIEKNPNVSQRELSNQLGVALGITNSLLKVLVRKGLVKIRGENNRSLTYHLTHAGVLAKSKLAMRWTLNTVDFYRHARRDVAQKMAALAADGVKTVILYGINEFAEIAVIVAHESGLEVKGFVAGSDSERTTVIGLPVIVDDLVQDMRPDAIILCVEPNQALAGKLKIYEDSGIKLYRLV